MAKGLVVGDAVKLKEPYDVPKSEAAYKQGLQHIDPQQVGIIVRPGEGRGFIVEFDEFQVMLSSQRLEVAPKPGKKRNRRTGQSASTASVETREANTSETQEDAAQRLEERIPNDASESVARKSEQSAQSDAAANTASTENTSDEENLLAYLNYQDAGLVRLIANQLLVSGSTSDAILMKELRFADLPERVQQQVRTLIQAKLSLKL